MVSDLLRSDRIKNRFEDRLAVKAAVLNRFFYI